MRIFDPAVGGDGDALDLAGVWRFGLRLGDACQLYQARAHGEHGGGGEATAVHTGHGWLSGKARTGIFGLVKVIATVCNADASRCG